MKRFLGLFSLCCLGILLFSACQKEPFVTINGPRNYEFSADGGTISFSFTCNSDWRASSTDSWVRISPSSGKSSDGEIKVTIICDANTTYDSRKAVLSISVLNLEEIIFVTQTTKAAALVSPSSCELTAEAQKLEINVQVNTNWYPEVDYYSMGWIEPDPEIKKTKGLESFTMVFNISENRTGKDRSGKIYVKMTDGPTLATVSVTQKVGRIEATSITLNKSSLALNEGDSETLIATVKPDDATDKTISWSSSNNNIAMVDANGKVSAIKQGSATITGKAGNKTATCSVTVNKNVVAVSSIELNKTEMSLMEGQSETLIATVKPENASDKTVTWSTSDTSIALVDNGKVTAVKAGTATITAKAGERSATCIVSVRKNGSDTNAIDLGLSVKWASCNIGASSSEQYGGYYAWGETETKEVYGWVYYKWCNGSYDTITKYNNKSSYGTVDNRTILEESDDIAHIILGGNWRIPTMEEWTELKDNCEWTYTRQNGVNGYRITSKTNGNSIFLPAAGNVQDTTNNAAGYGGAYWSSSLYTNRPEWAWCMSYDSIGVSVESFDRCYGFSLRPVTE